MAEQKLMRMKKTELVDAIFGLQEEKDKLKEENEKLLDDIELHPDYEDTIESTIETAQKELKEENEKIGGLVISQTIKLKDVSIKHNNLVMKLNELKEENKNLRIVMNWSQPPRTISIKEIQES